MQCERVQKAKEEKAKSRQSLQDCEDTLMHEEEVVKADLKAGDELRSNATSKLHDAVSATAVNKQTVNVATTMLDTAKTKKDLAMQCLEKIGQKRKLLSDKPLKLLEKAMSSSANAAPKKSKAKVTQSAKEPKQDSVVLFGCLCSKVVVGFYCKERIHLATVNFDIVSVCKKNCCLSLSQF